MQNVTYATRDLALASPCAPFELAACTTCGFLFNSRFDARLFTYDQQYDNHVQSQVFDRYYRSLATVLIERFNLAEGGIVYDVGCGQGTFLKILCAMAPNVSGIGIDPSCEAFDSGNVKLIQSPFSRDVIGANAKLVLLRHVIEHIERPVEFLRDLRVAVQGAPVFVEVPDTTWIFAQGAFWDFCYEHCNYFVPATLKVALARAGFTVQQQALCFEGQYQWAICGADGAQRETSPGPTAMPLAQALALARAYEGRESVAFDKTRLSLSEAARRGACAIWGMATKGVVFASILNDGHIAGGVDSNVGKQGRHAPGSGIAIHAPEWLARFDGKVTAFVMNPNYIEEIRAQLSGLHIRADLRLV